MTRGRHLWWMGGVALVGAHAIALPLVVLGARIDDLSVRVAPDEPFAINGPLAIRGDVAFSAPERVVTTLDGIAVLTAWPLKVLPGVHRVEWGVRYRGGFERRVGITRIVGPFQDLDKGGCGIRVRIGQEFLDDGAAGPGTLAYVLREKLLREVGPSDLGALVAIPSIRMWWSKGSEADALEGTIVHARGAGVFPLRERFKVVPDSVRLDLVLKFRFGRVPLHIALVPKLATGRLTLEAYVAGEARGFWAWIARIFSDPDSDATLLAGEEVRTALRSLEDALRPPFPVPLGGGKFVTFAYCPGQFIRVTDRTAASVPFAVVLHKGRGTTGPLALGRSRSDVPPTSAPLSVDIDLNAANGLLYDLWASGALDAALKEGVNTWFNRAEVVRTMLSVRVADASATLPPTIELSGDGGLRFKLGAEAGVILADGGLRTPARVFGRVGFDATSERSSRAAMKLALSDLALTCEPHPGLLVPCYSNLVEEVRYKADALHGDLAKRLAGHIDALTRGRRLGGTKSPVTFRIDSLKVSTRPDPPSGWIRLDAYGALVTSSPR